MKHNKNDLAPSLLLQFFLIASLIGISSLTCSAQDEYSAIDHKVNNKIAELEQRKADMIVCYYEPCYGSFMRTSPDSCTAYSVKYVLWQIKKKSFIQRFDNCRVYKPVQMNPVLLSFIQNNYAKLTTEKLKPLAYKITGNLKDSIKEILWVDHSCHYIFEIHWGSQRDAIDIDSFRLAESSDSTHPNLNFAANQKSILCELTELASNEVLYYSKSK
jgi:hypothetical protein